MTATRIELLQSMPVFGGIDANTLNFLLERTRMRAVSGGDYFFRQGDDGDTMFVLEQGHVLVIKTWEGKDYELCSLERGAAFGEMALVDLFPRSASVRALTDSTALELSAETLLDLYKHNVEQFTLIQMNIARELSRRLRETVENLFRVTRVNESLIHQDDIHSL